MKCFLCGAEYDMNSRPTFKLRVKHKLETCNIVKGVNGKVMAMCGRCTKAFVCGAIYSNFNYRADDIEWLEEIKYEGDEANGST